jgi:small subunit ribosomal protein S21
MAKRDDNNKFKGSTVVVHNGNLEKALRTFKKKIQEFGILNDYREAQFYEKPSVKKRREKNQQTRRAQRRRDEEQLPKRLY